MNREDFQLEMKRLITVFGPRAFSEPKMKRIWMFCEKVEVLDFKNIVDGFLDKSKSAPLPFDFKEASKHFLPKTSDTTPVPISCGACDDFGWLQAHGFSMGHLAIGCFCKTGKENTERFENIPCLTKWMTFKVSKFDYNLFFPREGESLLHGERILWWRSVIKKSEDFWKDNKPEQPEKYWQK